MRWMRLVMADKWRTPAEKKCDATKLNAPRSRSASSAEGTIARRTLAAIHKESTDARRPSNCCAMREASAPPRVDASTYPWRVTQCMNLPPVHTGSREGFSRLTFFTNAIRGEEALK